MSLMPIRCTQEVRETSLSPLYDLREGGPIPALTLSPAAWGEAFRLWRDGPGKDVENRSHGKYVNALLGKWVALHAGATVGCKGVPAWQACATVSGTAQSAGRLLRLNPDDVITRAIVAVGFVDAVYPPGVGTPGAGGGPWRFMEEWGYHFAEVVALEEPVKNVVGAQGVWYVNGEPRDELVRGFEGSRRHALARMGAP